MDHSGNLNCDMCAHVGGAVLWRSEHCRAVLVPDRDFPGFCRVIWNSHIKELTDLPAAQRHHLMEVVFAVERALREELVPDKVNVASLGNQTPHIHWHVIPRWQTDSHFPNPIWGERQRVAAGHDFPPDWRSRLRTRVDALLGPSTASA